MSEEQANSRECGKCGYDGAEEYYFCHKCEQHFCEECYYGDDLCMVCAFKQCARCGNSHPSTEGMMSVCNACDYWYCDECMTEPFCVRCTVGAIQQNIRSYLVHIRKRGGILSTSHYVKERRAMFEFLLYRFDYPHLYDATGDNYFMDNEYHKFRMLQAEDKTALVGSILWV